MKRLLSAIAVSLALFVSAAAFAEVKTVTLNVENMYCPSCPYIVQKSLTAVPGITAVKVSLEKKTATVTFDDAKTAIATLTQATTDAGYPSKLAE